MPASTDALFTEISRTVVEVDFDGMSAAYHPDAVVVTTESIAPVSEVMARWRVQGEKFQQEGGEATVSFRFSSRMIHAGVALDTGIFRYEAVAADGTTSVSFTHFENLATFRNGRWTTMMEHQLERATEAEWEALVAPD